MSYYHPRKAFGNEDVIYKARQYEKALRERLQFVHEYEGLMRYAQFEEVNGPRACHRSLRERLEGLRAQREEALVQRRRKLSMFLSAEDASLRNQIQTGSMNLSERRAWLLGQALALSSSRKLQLISESASGRPAAYSHQLTNLETALCEDYNEISMHDSKLAIRRAEAERQRQRENAAVQTSLREHGLADGGKVDVWDKQAIDILRQHLYMVERLRDEEKAAVEEDMISMNRRWLAEEEALRHKHLEHRQQQSLQVRDALLISKEENSACTRSESYEGHVEAMAAEKEAEEERQFQELKEAHMREALAYVCQLQAAAERQRVEDEELEASIRAHMQQHIPIKEAVDALQQNSPSWPADHNNNMKPGPPGAGTDYKLAAPTSEADVATSINQQRISGGTSTSTSAAAQQQHTALSSRTLSAAAHDHRLHSSSSHDQPRMQSSMQSTKDVALADALKSERRRCHAAELIDQEVKRLALAQQSGGLKPDDRRTANSTDESRLVKHNVSSTSTAAASILDLPYPEPYYGRKAVKWYE